jgi:hypothetical protein
MTTRDGESTPASAALLPHAFDVGEALDTLALQRLVWAYCHAVDRRDYILLRSLYHDDAIDDHGAMFCGSADAFVAWLPSMLQNWQATSHAITNLLFLIDGDQAEGELVSTAYHRTLDGSREIIAHGRYLDQYRKRDGVWRFWRRALAHDWMEDRAIAPGSADADIGIAPGRPSMDDPAYQRLPLLALQRRQRGNVRR